MSWVQHHGRPCAFIFRDFTVFAVIGPFSARCTGLRYSPLWPLYEVSGFAGGPGGNRVHRRVFRQSLAGWASSVAGLFKHFAPAAS